MKKGYISGKITGLHPYRRDRNFEKAVEQAREWAEKEYSRTYKIGTMIHAVTEKFEIINPLNIRPLFGIKKWLFHMIADIRELRKCDVIFVQDNWESSMGAFIEVFLSTFIWKIKVVKL